MSNLTKARIDLERAKRDLDAFNAKNPVIAMGSGEWDEHTKLMNSVASARRSAKQSGCTCTEDVRSGEVWSICELHGST